MQGLFDKGTHFEQHEDVLVFAIEMLDGRIFYDSEAASHADAIERLKLDIEQVKDGGFIIEDAYYRGSHDAARLADEARNSRKP